MPDDDVAVIGAGAAGLMAAISARRGEPGASVLLLDGRERFGAKILMSGGTRCNVTNRVVTERDFESENRRAVRHVLAAFPAERAAGFFEEIGVRLVLEPGGKYFPSTHSARTVLDALAAEARRSGVRIEAPCKVHSASFEENRFRIRGRDFEHAARALILCTGGLSYPETGSDGSGYAIARGFGHRLVATSPALTPLETPDAEWKALAGVTLPARLTLRGPEGVLARFEDSFLFTHFGFSGPAPLNLSRHWIRAADKARLRLEADFLPAASEEEMRVGLTDALARFPSRLLKTQLSSKVPERLAEALVRKAGIPEDRILNQLSRTERERLIGLVFRCPLEVSGAVGYKKAEVTAGGVDFRDVNPKTLESRLRPGLFFAGEILDADGRIGGFNFQWSWSSGFVAGGSAAQKAMAQRVSGLV